MHNMIHFDDTIIEDFLLCKSDTDDQCKLQIYLLLLLKRINNYITALSVVGLEDDDILKKNKKRFATF